MRYILNLVIFGTIASACVSNKKYTALQSDYQRAENEIAALEAGNSNLKERYKKQLIKTEEQENVIDNKEDRIEELRQKLEEQRTRSLNLKDQIEKALINYDAEEMPVLITGNRVYLSLPDWLLYPSGVDALDKKGKAVLSQVAPVLKSNPDLVITVEGHTDNVEVVSRFKDNWELSTERALSVARYLIEKNGVEPAQIRIAGRGATYPLASNDTPDGRAVNRRTVIIISPDTEELFDLTGISQ